MTCPYFKGNAICLARRRGLYVPAKDVEISLCSTEAAYPTCAIFMEATGQGQAKKRGRRGRRRGGTIARPPERERAETARSSPDHGNRPDQEAAPVRRGPDR